MYNPSLSRMSIEEYARSRYIENNFMTRYLIDKPGGRLTHADMLLAKKIIKFKCLVGLYDDIAESSSRFARYFGWRSDGQAARCAARAVAAGDRPVLGHPTSTRGENDRMSSRTSVRAGSGAWRAIAAQNRFDVELYEFARRVYRVQGEQIFDVAAASAGRGGGDVVGTSVEGVAAGGVPMAMAPVAVEPKEIVESPPDARAGSSGRRDYKPADAGQEALDREITDGMFNIDEGAAIASGAGGRTGGASVRGAGPSVGQPGSLEPSRTQQQQQQQLAAEDGDDDGGGDFVISDSDLEAQGLEGSFADGAESEGAADGEDQRPRADAGTDWMGETVDPSTLVPREKCQIIYHMAVEGAGHHGFMPVMDSFLGRQVEAGGYRGEKANDGDFVRKAIFRGFRGRDIGVDDPELVKNVVRRVCPDDGKKHVLQISDSFPSKALGAGGNQHYRNDRVNAWQTMTSAEIAESGEGAWFQSSA